MKIKTTEEFITEIKNRFPNQVTFEKTIYNGAFNKCIVTCPVHGDLIIIPHNVLRKNRLGVCTKCTSERLKKYDLIRQKNSSKGYIKDFQTLNMIYHKLIILMQKPILM